MDKSCNEFFGERLKELRNQKDLSQDSLAKELGFSKGALCYYENCARVPDITILDKVAKYFDVPIGYLMGYTKATKAENVSVCDQTGLSEEAVLGLKRLRSSEYNDESMDLKLFDLVNSLLGDSFSVELGDEDVIETYFSLILKAICDYANGIYNSTKYSVTDKNINLGMKWQAIKIFLDYLECLEERISNEKKEGEDENGNGFSEYLESLEESTSNDKKGDQNNGNS